MGMPVELKGHVDKVWQISWSPTELLFVSCSGDKSIRVWKPSKPDLTEWVCTKTLDSAHSRTIRSLAWNPDGNILASCSFDSTTGIWEKEYELVATLEGHENEVKCVSWSASGTLLATCSRDKSVWIWEAMGDGDFECIGVLQEHTQDVKSVAWHPHEEILASASYDDTIRLWKDDDGDWFSFQTLTEHASTVWAIDFDKSGDYLASVSDDQSLIVWKRSSSGYEVHSKYPNLHQRTIYSVSWSKQNNLIATCGGDNSFCIIEFNPDAENGLTLKKRYESAHGDSDINCISWCPLGNNSDLLATAGDDHLIRVWKIQL
ncbi:cytosolic iron-sulfur protein assembly [Boothiomyces macroporosus]|uniref:Probable cytosolic iron-sulfur protein assembly protein 1 n=1 Tax=Boothiomyces macroporosus TaxID=261099 RepID=A0AAD5UG82_9FUNG|nr:cytosolic iron-sulfur protein assembly [Boothiomyces macroporosus]